jgi:protein SCO1/2
MSRFNFGRSLLPAAWIVVCTTLTGCKTTEPCSECAETARATASAPQSASAFVSEWLAPDQRKRSIPSFDFENQDGGRISTADFRGAPVAISFVYTRCQNQRKCPLVAQTMAQLATALERTAISPKPKVLLMTYDPEFDTPAELKAFASVHHFVPNENAMLLRPAPSAKEQLIASLNVPVNYNEKGVNVHGIQLVMLDKRGRFVRAYHSLLWNNADVVADLIRLAAE